MSYKYCPVQLGRRWPFFSSNKTLFDMRTLSTHDASYWSVYHTLKLTVCILGKIVIFRTVIIYQDEPDGQYTRRPMSVAYRYILRDSVLKGERPPRGGEFISTVLFSPYSEPHIYCYYLFTWY